MSALGLLPPEGRWSPREDCTGKKKVRNHSWSKGLLTQMAQSLSDRLGAPRGGWAEEQAGRPELPAHAAPHGARALDTPPLSLLLGCWGGLEQVRRRWPRGQPQPHADRTGPGGGEGCGLGGTGVSRGAPAGETRPGPKPRTISASGKCHY